MQLHRVGSPGERTDTSSRRAQTSQRPQADRA